jgi:hypothetical protein
VLVDAPDNDGAKMDVYIRVPPDVSAVAESNTVLINPHPVMGINIESVELTTDDSSILNNQEVYTPINENAYYDSVGDAIGWVAPGGWTGDTIVNAAPKIFHFNPAVVTALKLTLSTDNYMYDNNTSKYVYTYGLGNVDVRYHSFLDAGKFIVRFDAPAGATISNVDNVIPEIWNVSEAELPDVFDYRVIWETSYDSGTYTTSPVSLSNRVWIEVTLNKRTGKGTPALSGLIVDYS